MDSAASVELPYRPFVYIAESEDQSIIKIGSSGIPGKRVASLRLQARRQLGCDLRFQAIAVWVEEDGEEWPLHEKFKEFSLGHEFYRWSKEIVEYAASQRHRFAHQWAWHVWSMKVAHRVMGWTVE